MPVPLPPLVLVNDVSAGRNVDRPFAALAPRMSLRPGLRLERACVRQRLLEWQELQVFSDTNVAGAQPVPPSLPPLVVIG